MQPMLFQRRRRRPSRVGLETMERSEMLLRTSHSPGMVVDGETCAQMSESIKKKPIQHSIASMNHFMHEFPVRASRGSQLPILWVFLKQSGILTKFVGSSVVALDHKKLLDECAMYSASDAHLLDNPLLGNLKHQEITLEISPSDHKKGSAMVRVAVTAARSANLVPAVFYSVFCGHPLPKLWVRA